MEGDVTYFVVNGKTPLPSSTPAVRKLIDHVLNIAHELDVYPGRDATAEQLSGYHWRNKAQDIAKHVQSCAACQQAKAGNLRGFVGSMHSAHSPCPGFHWIIDFQGPLPAGPGGEQYIFTATGAFSRYLQTMACKDCSAATAIECLQELVALA